MAKCEFKPAVTRVTTVVDKLAEYQLTLSPRERAALIYVLGHLGGKGPFWRAVNRVQHALWGGEGMSVYTDIKRQILAGELVTLFKGTDVGAPGLNFSYKSVNSDLAQLLFEDVED